MGLQSLLKELLEKYPQAQKEHFASHPIGDLVRGQLRGVIEGHIQNERYKVAPEGRTGALHEEMNHSLTPRAFAASLPKMSFITVVTRMARAGVPIQQAMAYVGHASEVIHKVYQRLKPSDVGLAIAAVGT